MVKAVLLIKYIFGCGVIQILASPLNHNVFLKPMGLVVRTAWEGSQYNGWLWAGWFGV